MFTARNADGLLSFPRGFFRLPRTCRRPLWVVYAEDKSVVSCVNCGVRYIRLSYEGSLRGVHAVAHHVLARPPFNLTLTGHADGAWIQLPQAGKGHVSTFSHSMSGLQTSSKSMLRGPSAHVNRSSMLKPVSSLTTVPASRPSPTTPTRRTRANRPCRARAAAVGHLRSHEEAYGGWRHTG